MHTAPDVVGTWHSSCTLCPINKVTVRRAWLVLG